MIGLLEFVDEHAEAVEFDLIGMGLRLRDFPSGALSWRDLLVICRQAPPGSAIARAVRQHPAQDPILDFLRLIEFRVRVLAWMQSEDGVKGRNVPEPVAMPWDAEPEGTIRGDVMAWDEAASFLGWEAEMTEYTQGGG